jgi:hypothetical protein
VARREKILRDHRLSFEEIAERATSYTLIGEQWAAWNELQDIAYLLGDDDSGFTVAPTADGPTRNKLRAFGCGDTC